MSQINDSWSWGQESSETNEDNSASTDANDWDDNSWGNSWDNNEIIQNDQQSVEAFNNKKCQTVKKNCTTLPTQVTDHNQHALYENNINSYNQDQQYYLQQREVIENQNYNAQGRPTQYKDQYPQHNHLHQFVDHNTGYCNYMQATSPTDPLQLNKPHNGQTYNTQLEGYIQQGDQTCPQYNSVIPNNNVVYENIHQGEVQYNQTAWFNPAEQMQDGQENQNMYHQVVSNLSGNNDVVSNVPETSGSQNYAALGVDNANVLFNTGSCTNNHDYENNELAMYKETMQSVPSISLGGSNKNSWYQDEFQNIPVDNTSREENVDNHVTTQADNEDSIQPNEASIATDKIISENEENIHPEFANQVELEPSGPINNNLMTEETNKLENIFNSIVQQEQMIKEVNIVHKIETKFKQNIDAPNIEQIGNDNHAPCEVIQEEIIPDDAVNESRILTNVENEISENKEDVPVASKEANDATPVDRTNTATPYDNLCEDISDINIENQVRSSPNGIVDNAVSNNNINNTNEEKTTRITDGLKGGPKKFIHLNLKTDQSVEVKVEKTSAGTLNQNQVAAEKLSRLKRDTEKTTKNRNQYLETGELQDSQSPSSHETDDDNDEAPTFVRMIPGSEMTDPNVAPNTSVGQCNTSDSGNKANSSLSTSSRHHTKSKRHAARSSIPQDSDSNSNGETDKVDDKKLMKIIKTIMSEEKAKKMRSKKKSGKDNLETTALRIAKILKAQEQAGTPREDSSEKDNEEEVEEQNSSFDRKPPLHNNNKPSPRLTDFEKYINSLPRRKRDSERSAKPSLTSSPIPLEDRMSAMSLQDRDKYPERLQRPFPQRTPPSRPLHSAPGPGYAERPYPQRTPPSNVYPDRPYPQRTPPTQTYSERSMRSPFTDVSSLDRRHTRKSSGDSFASHAQFLAGILANFPSITAEQSERMKRLTLTFPLEYKSWYMESYLPTLRKYKERMTEKTTVMRNKINKQFGKHCIGKSRLSSLMKFEGRNIHEYNIDVQRLFHCYEDSNYLHEMELLTPFTFDGEDKKCFYGFIQSMIPKANSLSEQLLYQLIELMFKSKGEIELSDIGDLLLRSYSKVKGSQFLRYPESELWRPRNTDEENFKLRQHAVNNQKQKAFQLALHSKDWALATILSSHPNSNFSRTDVHDAFLANLPANDPLRPCFQLMFNQNVQLNSSAAVDLNEWGIHLAAILNNSTPDTLDRAAILKLGHLLGNKGDHYGEQFCTLIVNAPWTRFKLLGAPCDSNDVDTSVTGRNVLLSMAYENAAKLRPHSSTGYQFVQLQYMKYYFALKLLRMGKKQLSLHFLHHVSEEALTHLAHFLPAHISLVASIVDCAGVCAGAQVQGLLWYTQLQHVLSQHIPARCVGLPPLQQPEEPSPSPSPSLERSTTQPEYAQPPSSLYNYGGYVDRPDPMRQTPVNHNMGDVRFNPVSNPMNSMDKSDMSGPRSLGHEMPRPLANEFGPKSLGPIPNDSGPQSLRGANEYGPKPLGNIANNLPSVGDPQRASAFNKPRSNAVRSNPMSGGNNLNRRAPLSGPMGTNSVNTPIGSNSVGASTPMNTPLGNSTSSNPLRSNPLGPQQTEGTFKPLPSQFFTPALVSAEQSTYMQHLQDAESSSNQISLNSSFSYAAQDSQNNDRKSGEQLGSSGVATGSSGGTSGGGWFGFLKKNTPAPKSETSAQDNRQESSHSSGQQVNPQSRAPTPQTTQYPAPSYSAPPQPYLPELSHESSAQSGFYQPQQQSISE